MSPLSKSSVLTIDLVTQYFADKIYDKMDIFYPIKKILRIYWNLEIF